MTDRLPIPDVARRHLTWPLRLTRAGLAAERGLRAFWPFLTIAMIALACLMLGLQDSVPLELAWAGMVVAVAGTVWTFVRGVMAFRWPSGAEAEARLDATLPGRPIAAIRDTQAVGAGDAASEAVWAAHVARMAERAKSAKAAEPDLRLADRDPFALRYVALLALVTATLFGSLWRVASVQDMAPGAGSGALAAGPSWEGWIEPPAYTGRPGLYLPDIGRNMVAVPEGSEITLRLYGEIGALSVDETVSGRTGEVPPATEPSQTFTVTRSGRLAIDGQGGQEWDIRMIPDAAPEVRLTGALEPSVGGEFRQPFEARDDHGVIAGRAVIALDRDRVDRSHGLAAEPEPREEVVLDLPMTITGDRDDFEETLIDNLAEHPWAGLPVTLTLDVEDAAGQVGTTGPQPVTLAARRFFDPLAAAIIEQRRDLLWTRENAPRVAGILRAVSNRPDDIFRSETAYLKLRVAIRRLETAYTFAEVSDELRDETAQVLWDIALLIEEGDLSDALERLRRAQDRLSEAIENGATDEEIAELMQELREAMQDYMRQLAEQAPEGEQEFSENTQEMTGDQLEDMLQRLQELMEQGRMAEAQQLLEMLRQMMENMQIARGQQGEGQQSPGQQAMEGLAETLREQQGLSDEAFRDLQEQFGQQGQNQPGQQGQNQPGQGMPGTGQQPGQGQEFGQGQGQGDGSMPDPRSLAERQEALREELRRQAENLPGAGTPEGDAARDSLDRAGRAMEGAEEDLRNEDFAGALDDQSEAIEALREGMRELAEQMAQQEGQPGGQGEAMGQANQAGRRDPLGREAGESGRLGTEQNLLQGEDVYRRARDLLDEIRRRSSDQSRPAEELEYLKRLLDRF